MPSSALNILWITCDELRADAVSTYGNAFTSMPAAERLAAEGTQFDQAFCQMPKCVPSRCSMLTGRYPHVDGFRTLLGRVGAPPHPEVADNSMVCLQADTPNLIPYLREHGYRTALLGKNHIVEWNLHQRWFDATSSWRWQRPPHQPVSPELARADYAGPLPADFPFARSPDAVSAQEMIEFIEGCQDRPFFGLLDMQLPHPAYQEYPTPVSRRPLSDFPVPSSRPLDEVPPLEHALRTSKNLEHLSDDDRRRIRRAYYSMAEFADQQIARVLDALDRLGLTENTLVIYTADHGDFAGDHNCYEKWDTSLLDCIVRVPLLMRLPGRLPAGHRVADLVELVDLLPTTLELADLPTPAYAQGHSLVTLAHGEGPAPRTAAFAGGGVEASLLQRLAPPARPDGRPSVKQQVLQDFPWTMHRAKMVRTASHKLIYRLHGGHELYDLAADPEELHNRFGDPALAAIQADLQERLLRFLIESETTLPEVGSLTA